MYYVTKMFQSLSYFAEIVPPHPFFKGKAPGTRLCLDGVNYQVQTPYPIIVYSMANYRLHLSPFWANM